MEIPITSTPLPEQITAVILDSYNGGDALRVVQRPILHPGPNEVLIKIAAAALNPSDLMFIEGRYLAGKRVACVTQQNGGRSLFL